MPVNFNITNQLASPAIYASSFATRPAPSFIGRLFVDTNTPSTGIYRDTGTVWVAVAGSAAEAQSLQNVCQIGNTTTTGVLITGQSAFGTQGGDPIGPIGDYTVSIGETSLLSPNNSLICQHNALFETNVFINTSVLCPLIIGGDATTSTLTFKTTTGVGATGARHIFQVGNNGATEAMTILNNANVGIGINSPLSKFQVFDSTVFSYSAAPNVSAKIGASGTGGSFLVNTPSANSTFESGFAIDGTYTAGKTVVNINAFGVFSGGPYSADLAFKTSTNTTLSEKMRLTNTGNLLIGTTTDAGFKLDVNGTAKLGALTVTSATFSSTIYSGATSVNASAQLEADSTTKGFLPPRMTTTQKNAIAAPAAGLIIYDTTLNKLCVYTTAWETITSI